MGVRCRSSVTAGTDGKRANTSTIATLARALERRELTAQALTEECLAAIAKHDRSINAFITVFADDARAQARTADAEIARNRYRGPLHGIPVCVKDIIDMAGVATTAASRVRRGHIADKDATIVERLRAAGAVIVGKTNLHEFALGTTNEDSAFGPVRHPLDPSRSPGGSSGGSAAAVFAGMAVAGIGTDTGGSVRIPASVCGLVGLKPDLGEIPTEGVVPLSMTLDHVGPICRSSEDAGILYDVLRGAAHAGSTGTRPASIRTVTEPAARETKNIRLAVLGGYFLELLDPGVETAFRRSCEQLRNAGVTLRQATITHASAVASVYVHLALTEAAACHATSLERQPDDYTPAVRLRLEMGKYILQEDYVRALAGRDVLRRETDEVLREGDGLLLPTLPVVATPLGAESVRVGQTSHPVRNVMLRLTQLFNITGHPAITLPSGLTSDGLPVGVQLVGTRNGTSALLQLAETLEPYLGPGVSR